MDRETVGNIVLLAIVTLISVVQNGFFAHKVEHESKTQNGRASRGREHLPLNASTLPRGAVRAPLRHSACERCEEAKTVWTRTPRSLSCSGARGCSAAKFPAAFAGLMYLFVRQKYFVGYLGERTQRFDSVCVCKRGGIHLFRNVTTKSSSPKEPSGR
ncbi:arachidonate 5-lipoxygenase-activating protein isoform X3 [Lynx canadensis]|uniref:arachidonate 5-lipoxygenase-activating protein isoform X3 n=1 Tax=Lynx canadensis TaxID=61383 RepID=UPI0011B064E8|nr:arachidonate 5-lipoxygenase-activating protein isoform X3 [Lynx canadensis]